MVSSLTESTQHMEGHVGAMASVTEQLKDLVELRKEGVLTPKEFEEQKEILLTEARARASQTSHDPTMLTEVGAYKLLGLIGEGGMGAVYRGRHRSEAMAERQCGDVAVKVIHPQYARNPDYRDRFEREAALGMKLDHPGIVKVHDLVVDGGNLALVMDFIEGQPLSESIGEVVGPIPWDRAWPLFQKLLAAVGYAHDEGVVHRDMKPENILVTPDGEPHVIDFGIAKDLDSSGTRTGTGMGTVEYMAPEQYTDAKAVDRRADVYSLGMILYEMLAGRLPWGADAPQFEILEQKARKQLMSPSAYCPVIPQAIVAALSPALSSDPDRRTATTAAFSSRLEGACSSVTPHREVDGEAEEAGVDSEPVVLVPTPTGESDRNLALGGRLRQQKNRPSFSSRTAVKGMIGASAGILAVLALGAAFLGIYGLFRIYLADNDVQQELDQETSGVPVSGPPQAPATEKPKEGPSDFGSQDSTADRNPEVPSKHAGEANAAAAEEEERQRLAEEERQRLAEEERQRLAAEEKKRVEEAELASSPGTVKINSYPGAKVYVDGVSKGTTFATARGIELSPGIHKIRLVRATDGKEQFVTVEVKGGQTQTVPFQWED